MKFSQRKMLMPQSLRDANFDIPEWYVSYLLQSFERQKPTIAATILDDVDLNKPITFEIRLDAYNTPEPPKR